MRYEFIVLIFGMIYLDFLRLNRMRANYIKHGYHNIESPSSKLPDQKVSLDYVKSVLCRFIHHSD